MSIQDNKKTLERFDRIVEACDAEALDEVCTPDMVNHALGAHRPSGLEGTKEFLRECRRDPGKSRWRSTSQFKSDFVTVAEGDYVIQYGTRVGTWFGGRLRGFDFRAGEYQWAVAFMYRFEDGLIAERWALHSDDVALLQLRAQAEELRASRKRIVAAADDARRRVERDLHDGAQQHLVLIALKLGLVERQLVEDPNGAAGTLSELRSDLDRALQELRELAHGIYPSELQTDGIAGALRNAAARAAIPTTLDCDGIRRYPPELEAAVYFCCVEALQNASKYAGPYANATIRLSEQAGTITFQVRDNGVGFDSSAVQVSAGIQNMTDRIGALGGDLTVRSEPGAGTSVEGTVPVHDQ